MDDKTSFGEHFCGIATEKAACQTDGDSRSDFTFVSRQPPFYGYTPSVGVNRHYSERIKTFKYWPKAMPLKAQQLAHSGFIYTGPGDKVECVWCRIRVYNFEATDNICAEHYKFSPNCEYLKMTLPLNIDEIVLCTK